MTPQKVLIANRGEIACRILRTLRRLQIPAVAVYSDPDAAAPHVRLADQAVRIGGPAVADSYLRADAILDAAAATGVTAIHPGYGLLSENATFAAACEAAGVTFVGPTPAQIRDFGVKDRAREIAYGAGVPICPGTPVLPSAAEAVAAAQSLGFPVLLKAVAGGGGIGMRLCGDEVELRREFEAVRRLAATHFGSGEVFLERCIEGARHVEVQIFGDGEGAVIALGERDCSLQRRRQKVVEEAPAAGLDASLVAALSEAATALGRAVRYRSAGTVEFLVDPQAGTFYFLEVNTRLQVEHCVTEEVCGVDLVEWMLRLAAGDAAPMQAYRHRPRGHAVEVRVYAEDPERDFRPSAGTLTAVTFAQESRVETWVDAGTEVTPFYDPLLAKIVAWGETRHEAIARLQQALRATEIAGVQTNLDYLRGVLAWPSFREHAHHTRSLEAFAFQSSAVDVVVPGDLTTVQDHPGRLGYWDVGVPPSGPMDALSFRLGNRILGNVAGAAGLEMTLGGPTLRFRRDALVCLAGAPIEAATDAGGVAMWQPLRVPAGATLVLGTIEGPGARTYLLVRGGIAVPSYLGSKSTFTLGGFGGHCGRALRADDVLPLGAADDAGMVPDAPLDAADAAHLAHVFPHDWTLRVLAGPHGSPEFFTEDDMARFHAEAFEVHYQSARTGVRLVGPKPTWARADGGEAGLHPSNIHDTAYSVGAVDYTGDMPVILGPDGPSLGGFTCPAVVIDADRWKLGQLTAGARVRFRAVSAQQARDLATAQERTIASRAIVLPRPSSVSRRDDASVADGVLERRAARPPVPEVTYRQSGDRDVLVEYGPMRLDLDLRVRVQLLYEALRARTESGEWRGVVDLTPGVRSLQIHYDPVQLDRRRLLDGLVAVEDGLPSGAGVTLPTRIVRLPLSWDDPAVQEAIRKYMRVVRDDAPWCPSNIEFIRRVNGLDSEADVRRIVFEASYLVLGLGDVYLGAPVATPVDPRHRLVTTKYNPARTWTPENAVGIGGAYLCVYGMEGPGGYQFVGRTVPVWNIYRKWKAETPWLLRFFDQIQFFPVTAAELLDYRRGVRDGSIEVEVEEGVFDVDAHHRFLATIADSAEQFGRRQRTAFDAERQRWREAGEFDAAKRAEADLGTRRREPGADVVPEGCIAVTAPLGAQVWRVTVGVGDAVEAGGELCVLAAMKMETTVAAPAAGRIETIFVGEGDVISAGSPLVAIRPRTSTAARTG